MLQGFGDEIWTMDGPQIKAAAGFHYPTRMIIIRLADQSLFVWSPIALSTTTKEAVKQLGNVSYIIAPNSLHDTYLLDWHRAYPLAKIYAAPGLSAKRKDIQFEGELTDGPNPEWADQIDQVVMRGNAITQEVVFFHLKSRTVIFTDLVQQMPANFYRGWRRIVAKLDLMIGDHPQVPRKFRIAFTKKDQARQAVEKIQTWPTEKVLMAHGTPVEQEGKAFIEKAFAWLK